MPAYNGHHCRSCWNIALWIGNDEGLYRLALECKRKGGARRLLRELPRATPDGYRYTLAGVRRALTGLG